MENDLRVMIREIVRLIINKEAYSEAARLMIENSITVDKLSKLTLKLSIYKLAKLTDAIIKIKKGK